MQRSQPLLASLLAPFLALCLMVLGVGEPGLAIFVGLSIGKAKSLQQRAVQRWHGAPSSGSGMFRGRLTTEAAEQQITMARLPSAPSASSHQLWTVWFILPVSWALPVASISVDLYGIGDVGCVAAKPLEGNARSATYNQDVTWQGQGHPRRRIFRGCGRRIITAGAIAGALAWDPSGGMINQNDRSRLLMEALGERILVLDGAMGTAIQQRDLAASDFGGAAYEGSNDHLVLTRPDVILEIHRGYLDAGSDIIETNSFNGTAGDLKDFGLADKAYEINHTAAKLARQAADEASTTGKPRFVAGSMGPTTKAMTVTGGITFEELKKDYHDQALALVEAALIYCCSRPARIHATSRRACWASGRCSKGWAVRRR